MCVLLPSRCVRLQSSGLSIIFLRSCQHLMCSLTPYLLVEQNVQKLTTLNQWQAQMRIHVYYKTQTYTDKSACGTKQTHIPVF